MTRMTQEDTVQRLCELVNGALNALYKKWSDAPLDDPKDPHSEFPWGYNCGLHDAYATLQEAIRESGLPQKHEALTIDGDAKQSSTENLSETSV